MQEDSSVIYSIPGGLGPIPRAALLADMLDRSDASTRDMDLSGPSIFEGCHTPSRPKPDDWSEDLADMQVSIASNPEIREILNQPNGLESLPDKDGNLYQY